MGGGASTTRKPSTADPEPTIKPGNETASAGMMLDKTPCTLDALSAAPTRNASTQELAQLDFATEQKLAASMMPSAPYGTETYGTPATFEFRRFLSSDGARVSYWHDVPLFAPGGGFHVVIEIPRMTRTKMEICTTEAISPIKQDVKKGKLRDYNMPIKWNYGALPQTWEQPEHVWQVLKGLEGHQGDNDPVDIVDLSPTAVECGTVITFKPLAALAMIDEGEVDWKIIGINTAGSVATVFTGS